MGLNFKGKPLNIGSDLGIEVPTATFSGLKSSDPDTSINPYTEQGPGPGGTGLDEDEINEIQESLLPTGALVPFMTSNTVPSGIAEASTTWPGQAPWMAFEDQSLGVQTWLSNIGVGGNAWLSYEFESIQTVLSYTVIAASDSNVTRALKDWTLQGWDGDSYVTLDTVTGETGWGILEERTFTVDTPGTYIKYKIHATANDGDGNGFISISQWQMYNEDLNPPVPEPLDLIPIMTSATLPSGVASASSSWATVAAWNAFDDPITGTIWLSAISVNTGWLAYEFTESKTALSYTIQGAIDSQTQRALKSWTMEGWTGATWDVLDTVANETGWGIGETRTFTSDTSGSYIKYRLNITATNDAGQGFISVGQWQLYSDDQNA